MPRQTLTPRDLMPVQRVDAVVPGDALQLGLAEELDRLAPFGMGNPEPALLVPSALLGDPRPMGEGRHVSFTLAAGGARSRCVAFGRGSTLPAAPGEPVDAAVRLEINRYNGAVEPRLVLRHAQPARPAPIEIAGELPFGDAVRAELGRDLTAWPVAASTGPPVDDLRGIGDGLGRPPGRTVRDVRGGGIAGLLGDLVAAGAPVLAVTAHAQHRAAGLRDRVGGFTIATWAALESDPGLAAAFAHVVVVDPPAHAHLRALADSLPGDGWTHLAWGGAELELARRVLAWELDVRPQLVELYPALRAEAAAAPGARRPPHSPVRRSRPCSAARARSRGPVRSPGGCSGSSPSSTSSRWTRSSSRSPSRRRGRGRSSSARRRSARTPSACATGSRTWPSRLAAREPASVPAAPATAAAVAVA